MIRGIEGKAIFYDNRDRQEFVTRLGNVTKETGTRILAWNSASRDCTELWGVHLRDRQGCSKNGGKKLEVQNFPCVPQAPYVSQAPIQSFYVFWCFIYLLMG